MRLRQSVCGNRSANVWTRAPLTLNHSPPPRSSTPPAVTPAHMQGAPLLRLTRVSRSLTLPRAIPAPPRQSTQRTGSLLDPSHVRLLLLRPRLGRPAAGQQQVVQRPAGRHLRVLEAAVELLELVPRQPSRELLDQKRFCGRIGGGPLSFQRGGCLRAELRAAGRVLLAVA